MLSTCLFFYLTYDLVQTLLLEPCEHETPYKNNNKLLIKRRPLDARAQRDVQKKEKG